MIVGVLDVTDAIKDIEGATKAGLKRGIARGISLVQEEAKAGCRSVTGELRESIFTDVEDKGDVIRGICFTNKKYAPYVEFGTGPKGQTNHEGISPEVVVAYTQSPWWIHEGSGPGPNEIDRKTAEFYHFPCIETPQGRFYQCTGQPAQPFMYPALKNNEDEIIRIVKEAVRNKK